MRVVLPILVLLALGVILGLDPPAGGGGGTSAPSIDPEPCLAYEYGSSLRFGVTVKKAHDGKPIHKRLTFSTNGSTNSTLLRIGGKDVPFKDVPFGNSMGKWLAKKEKIPPDPA